MPYKVIGALLKKSRERMLQLHGRLHLLVQRHCMKHWYLRESPGWAINELVELSEFLFHLEEEKPDEIRAQLNYHYIWRIEEGLNKGTPKRDNLVTHCYVLGFVVTLELLSIEQTDAFSNEETRGIAVALFEEMQRAGFLSEQETKDFSPHIDIFRAQLKNERSSILERIQITRAKESSSAELFLRRWEQTLQEQCESLWAGLSKFSPSLVTVRNPTPPVALLFGEPIQMERVDDELHVTVSSDELYQLAVELPEAKYVAVLQAEMPKTPKEQVRTNLLYPQHPGQWTSFPKGLSKLFQMRLKEEGHTRLYVLFFSDETGERLQTELPTPFDSSYWTEEERTLFLSMLLQNENLFQLFSFQVNVYGKNQPSN